jgi:hypothetical protein
MSPSTYLEFCLVSKFSHDFFPTFEIINKISNKINNWCVEGGRSKLDERWSPYIAPFQINVIIIINEFKDKQRLDTHYLQQQI